MKVANTYKNWNYDETKAYNKNGKLYVKATCKCGRCVNGIFPSRIENGRPVPYPVANGICFACNGTGIEEKEVRLYTDKEFETMERANARAAEKKAEERKQRDAELEAEAPKKIAETLEKQGFNEDGFTYVIIGDSYSIKEELKEAGFRYDGVLKWHAADPGVYEDRAIKVHKDEVFSFNKLGSVNYVTGAAKHIEDRINEASADTKSEWIGQEKEKITDYPVTLVSIKGFEGRYGYSQVVNFVDECGNHITWFTATEIKFEVGQELLMSATIKKLDEYKGTKTTTVTRAKLKEA